MNRKETWVGAAFILALVVGLGYAAWRISHPSKAQICQVCDRPIHIHTRTVGLVGDRRESFCCPACALTTHGQTGKAVRVVELTDYETHAALLPDRAYMLRGSDVNPCAHSDGHVGPDKQPTVVHFDRCSPSLLAFATRQSAASFAREHGGEVLSFSEFAAAYSR